jgi:hypothetical protein
MRLQSKALALWDFGPQRLAVVANYVSVGATNRCAAHRGARTHMNVLDLSRWQFGITTVYHFILV